jgi:hypothetical protein
MSATADSVGRSAQPLAAIDQAIRDGKFQKISGVLVAGTLERVHAAAAP